MLDNSKNVLRPADIYDSPIKLITYTPPTLNPGVNLIVETLIYIICVVETLVELYAVHTASVAIDC